ncbi:efflux RND transporter periplasmic adaptor subunit [Bacteroidota bacterium]
MNSKLLIIVFSFSLLLITNFCSPPENNNQDNQTTTERIVPVEALIVNTESITQTISLTGTLEPFNSVDIIAEVTGEIMKINKELGNYVTTKDTLAVIDDVIPKSQLKQAEAQVLSAKNNLKISESNLKSDEILFENGDISQLAYDNSLLAVKNAEAGYLSALASLSLTEKTYNDTRITSPIRGVISRKYINLGTMASSGMSLYRVVDLSRLKIEVNVPQEYINRIITGSSANIYISALLNKKFEGAVKRISPQADETTGGFMIEISVRNDNKMSIKAGMTCRIELVLSNLEDQLTVPEYAILTKENKDYIYKVVNNRAKLQEVNILDNLNGYALIAEGITEGDTIITVGINNLGIDTKIIIEDIQ